MFCRNEIDGFLKGKIKNKEGEEELYFDITSKQNLLRIYERKTLGFEEIKDFFYSWRDVMNEAERYLLNPVFLQCNPEFIYYNLSDGTYHWIFYPTDTAPELPPGLEDLSEFLLEKVNRRDYDALDVAYRFHHDVKDGNFFLKEIIKTIEEIKVRTLEGGDFKETEEYLPEEVTIPEPEIADLPEEEGFGEKILGKIGRFFSGKGEKTTKERNGKKEQKNAKRVSEKTEKQEEWDEELPVGRTWMEEEYEESAKYEDCAETSKTVLLSGNEGERILTSVKDGKTYSLENLPILVGKLEKDVDIVLNDPSISRLHARFYESDGKIFLEDLNSTNGCVLNNIRLQTNEKAELSSGDRIRIGAVEFIYGIRQ